MKKVIFILICSCLTIPASAAEYLVNLPIRTTFDVVKPISFLGNSNSMSFSKSKLVDYDSSTGLKLWPGTEYVVNDTCTMQLPGRKEGFERVIQANDKLSVYWVSNSLDENNSPDIWVSTSRGHLILIKCKSAFRSSANEGGLTLDVLKGAFEGTLFYLGTPAGSAVVL